MTLRKESEMQQVWWIRETIWQRRHKQHLQNTQ